MNVMMHIQTDFHMLQVQEASWKEKLRASSNLDPMVDSWYCGY